MKVKIKKKKEIHNIKLPLKGTQAHTYHCSVISVYTGLNEYVCRVSGEIPFTRRMMFKWQSITLTRGKE